jgi:hypothetical protein
MSVMYRVYIQAVERDRLICRVTVVYRDEPLNPSRTLAFRFIWESWLALASGYSRHLPSEEGVSEEAAREMARASPLAREMAGRDMDDLDWCNANAGRFVHCVGVTDFVNYDPIHSAATDPAVNPQATYTILVTDPGWLAHLSPGMEWESYSFEDDVYPQMHPKWRSPDVMSLARGIDTSQDFSGMPVLADALQEAGCDADTLLGHLRDPACKHARGCWTLERILGRF